MNLQTEINERKIRAARDANGTPTGRQRDVNGAGTGRERDRPGTGTGQWRRLSFRPIVTASLICFEGRHPQHPQPHPPSWRFPYHFHISVLIIWVIIVDWC